MLDGEIVKKNPFKEKLDFFSVQDRVQNTVQDKFKLTIF